MIKYRYQYITLLITFACHSIFSMEHPQLQLETQKKQIVKYVNCSIMIPQNTNQDVAYCMKTVHDAIFEHSNLKSSIEDPIILLCIQNNSTQNSFNVPLPAKLFINCTDGSILHLHETDGSKLFQSHPIFKKIPLKITATCIKNPNIEGNSFAEQFTNAMNEFYEDPGIPWVDTEHKYELEKAGIITTRAIVHTSHIILGPHGPIIEHIKHIFFKHGPNGCPDEKTFIQSIIDEKMAPLAPNKSCFKTLRNRELTGSFGKNS